VKAILDRSMSYADVKKRFGLVIKTWRRKSGISQEELAWRAGLHRSYVADIERGARNASLQSIEKLAKALNKGAKIDLVRNWLASADKFELASEDVVALAEAYLQKWDRKPGGPKGKRVSKDAAVIVEQMGKLDDLADCLLQGMAFIKWEENKRVARHIGIEALISPSAR